jgi:hypothetical protein
MVTAALMKETSKADPFSAYGMSQQRVGLQP